MADKTPLILVPMGFSEQSIQALDQALVFAKAMKASMLLLAVNNNDIHLRKIFDVKDRKEDIHDKLEAKLKSIAAEHSASSGVSIETMLTEGVVYEEIDRVSKEKDVDLVIMGTNGKPQNLKKRFIGSNAFRTVTSVEPPVITIKGIRNISAIDTIIFPLVLDRRSKEKVGPALHYARIFGAKIKVVSVLIEEDKEKILKANLKQVETFIKDHGIECSSDIIKPSKENKGIVRNTLNYAYENNGDLMIITEDSKERDFTDFFIGTDVQAMIYHSEIPVMSITPSEVKWAAMWEGI